MMDQRITDEAVPELMGMLAQVPDGFVLAIDTETTGLFPYEDDVIRGVCIAFMFKQEIRSFYLPVGYPDGNLSPINQALIFGTIQAKRPYLLLHNGKFDFAFLRQLGDYFPFPEPHQWWDTKVVSWLLDENIPSGLKDLAAFYWGEDSKDEQKRIRRAIAAKAKAYDGPDGPGTRSGWGLLTAEETVAYGAKDAELTYRLWQEQLKLVCGLPPILGDVRPALEREFMIQAVLSRMERTGILVDERAIHRATEKARVECDLIEEEFQAQTSCSITSPLQLARVLYDDLGLVGKSRSTARGNLEALVGQDKTADPIIEIVLKHRRLKKALTGYLVPLKARLGRDGRVHASFKSWGTVTGRFSCSEPNLQTIPRGDTLIGIRELFIAEDGYELWEYDLAAAEMRVIAGMADETVLIDSINGGTDMHGALAIEVFGEGFTGIQRRYCKNLGYGWFYGLTSLATASKYIAGKDGPKIAQKVLEGLKSRYKKVHRLMGTTTRQAQKDGYVKIHEFAWPGRFRRFVTQGVRRPAPYTALNAQVQGGIGEFMKDVMILSEPLLNGVGARLCLQVHDALVIEVPVGLGPKVLEILQSCADDLNPFAMRMEFTGNEWGVHE